MVQTEGSGQVPRSAQAIYRSVEDKLEALQDEVNLLKIEVKQTLVDLREFMMKDRGFLSQAAPRVARGEPQVPPTANNNSGDEGTGARRSARVAENAIQEPASGNGSGGLPPDTVVNSPGGRRRQNPQGSSAAPAVPQSGAASYSQSDEEPPMVAAPPAAQAAHASQTNYQQVLGFEPSEEYLANTGLDVAMLGSIVDWLGTIKRRGLSPKHIIPYLEAYEATGHLTTVMAKLILGSVAALNQMQGGESDHEFSAEDYSECLRQLHQIICTSGYQVPRQAPQGRVTGNRRSPSRENRTPKDQDWNART